MEVIRNITSSRYSELDFQSSLSCRCSFGNEDAVRRVYLITGAMLLVLGLVGNFLVLAVLSKERFKSISGFTMLFKSHAIANIFHFFIGLFLGSYVRALSNFDLQRQFGVLGNRSYLAVSYILWYATSWHYVAASCLRLLLSIKPSFNLSSPSSRCLIATTLIVIVFIPAIIISSTQILSTDSYDRVAADHLTSKSLTNKKPKTATQAEWMGKDSAWNIVEFAAAAVVPFSLVVIIAVSIPIFIRVSLYRASKNMVFSEEFESVPPSRHVLDGFNGIVSIIIYYQDVLFIFLSFPVLLFFLLVINSPASLLLSSPDVNISEEVMGKLCCYGYPVANLLWYATGAIQFPVVALFSGQRSAHHHRKQPVPSQVQYQQQGHLNLTVWSSNDSSDDWKTTSSRSVMSEFNDPAAAPWNLTADGAEENERPTDDPS